MKKKIMALFLSLALCASLLAACGEKEKEKEGNGDADPGTEESGDPVKLTVWVPDSTRIEDWNTNEMTLWLEEQANVDLDIVVLSSDDYSTKVNMALTAGKISDLPDIILGSSNFSSSMVYDWAKAEAVLSLTDYYNDPDLAVNINEAIERTGVDYTKHITSPDGNIYGIASYNQSYGNEYPNKLWIYKPWLDALGKDVPTTTEEFYELLKLVSETDLNGNGKNDEIGMAGSSIGSTYGGYLITLMDAFAYAGDTNYLAVNDGVVSASYTTDEWKKGLEYTAKLFSEELIAT